MPYLSVALITIGAAMAALGVTFYYMLFREMEIDRIERFLSRQHRNKTLYFHYLLMNPQITEGESLLSGMIESYKHPQRKAFVQALHAVYRKQYDRLKEAIDHMPSGIYRTYYEACALIHDGSLEHACRLAASMPKPWMRESLLAEIEVKAGNLEQAIAHAKKTLQHTRGIQRYVAYKTYERDLPEALNGL